MGHARVAEQTSPPIALRLTSSTTRSGSLGSAGARSERQEADWKKGSSPDEQRRSSGRTIMRSTVDQRWPAVIALSGLPFAGKSTLAGSLAAELSATLIEVDRLIPEREMVPPGPVPDQLWLAAYRQAEALVRMELAGGRRVIYDGVNFRWVQREKLRRVAAAFGQRVLVVQVTTPIAANLARQHANRLAPTRPSVDAETFAMVQGRSEPPRPGEWAVDYDGSESFASWLGRTETELTDRVPDRPG